VHSSDTASRWVPGTNSLVAPQLRLLCFPYAGGMCTIFREWPNWLPREIEVWPVELPGRGKRLKEPLFKHLIPLVDVMIADLFPYLDKPFALFGHSLGALLGFEMARRLSRDYDRGPVHLFVSGQDAPQVPKTGIPWHTLPDADFWQRIRDLNGTPDGVINQPELMHLMLPILRSDFELSEKYEYHAGSALDCPITAFGGTEDPLTSTGRIGAWRQQTQATFKLILFPGSHFFLHTAQRSLCDTLTRELAAYISSTV